MYSRGARDSLEGKPQSTIVDKFWEKFSQKGRRGRGFKGLFPKIYLFLLTEASLRTVTTFQDVHFYCLTICYFVNLVQ